ncbi:MAG: hypothetical protein ACKVUT_14095 [Gaiella sp.]
MRVYGLIVVALSALFVALGVAILVVAAAGERPLRNYLFGALFIVLGAARLGLERSRRR